MLLHPEETGLLPEIVERQLGLQSNRLITLQMPSSVGVLLWMTGQSSPERSI